ncbi:MAG TPA: zinc-binding dehydrogenase [Thermoleophilaceae bacterium]|nr:zinc-binding dehydrogenase [Thermoleophilaceae bacterium]
MKAAVIEEIGSLPVYKDVEEPTREPGQTLIEVSAAPLNPVDLSTAAGTYPGGSPPTPYVPGREGVGRVLESDSFDHGARVYGAGLGFMAERCATSDDNVVPLPEEGAVDDALASCFGVAGLAAWLALEWRGDLREGETVLVLGASGAVGAIAVQAAKLLGAGRVVAAARSDKGLERAGELGADATVKLGEREDLANAFQEAADGQLDLTIDPLWGDPAVAAIKATSFGGRLVQLGQSASTEATIPSGAVRTKLLSILGHTNMAAPAEVRNHAYLRMIRHAGAGELTVEYEVMPLAKVREAWELQASSPGRKLVLSPSDVP